jgi:hypothetical protein
MALTTTIRGVATRSQVKEREHHHQQVVIALVMDATPPLHQMEYVLLEETSTEEAMQNRWMHHRHHIKWEPSSWKRMNTPIMVISGR